MEDKSNNFFPLKNTMEWSNEICLRLIDEYKNFPALWDQTSPFYKNKLKRKESWCRLAERFGCSKAEVERKMNVLLTQYRREKHKMLMQVYKGEIKCSRWYAFKKFSFMENGLRPKKQQRALQLFNAMQIRLGYNPLQSVQTATSSTLQNLTSWHSSNEILNQSEMNSTSANNDPESSCPPVQDLSMNNPSTQMHNNNSIQQQSANSTIEDETVEINVDPMTLLSQSAAKLNHIRQRQENMNYHHGVKEEVFDSSSVDNDEHQGEHIADQSYQDNDQHEEDEFSIIDYRRNRYSTDISPKRKNNFHNNSETSYHHPESQQSKEDKSNRWTALIPPTEKPSTTKLFQNYDNQSMSLADKDDCDFIGLNVALKLRSMEESQRIIAEKLISDVLFYGQFKELDKTANVCPQKDSS